jgi:hypothetical protein
VTTVRILEEGYTVSGSAGSPSRLRFLLLEESWDKFGAGMSMDDFRR